MRNCVPFLIKLGIVVGVLLFVTFGYVTLTADFSDQSLSSVVKDESPHIERLQGLHTQGANKPMPHGTVSGKSWTPDDLAAVFPPFVLVFYVISAIPAMHRRRILECLKFCSKYVDRALSIP